MLSKAHQAYEKRHVRHLRQPPFRQKITQDRFLLWLLPCRGGIELSSATFAVVVDVEAELVHHSNGTKFLRLLLTQEAAQGLWRDLGELFS